VLELRCQFARELSRGYLPASADILPRPERGEVATIAVFGVASQGRHGGAGQRKRRRRSAHRPEFPHDPIHNAARRPTGKKIRQRGVAGEFALEDGAMSGTRGRFGAEQVGGPDLHGRRTQCHGGRDTRGVGNAARSLGPEGVKKGLTTTLPLALGLLQSEGAIRRVPVNGRIDQQRYKYALWKVAPQGSFTDLASRYFRWIGAASISEFQWFSGLGVKATKEAVAPLNLLPLQGDLLALAEDRAEFETFEPPKNPHYVLTGILDNISHLRRATSSLVTPEDAGRDLVRDGGLSDFPHHAILDRGRLIGLWHFDPETSTIAWNSFIKKNRALEEAIARTEAFIREDLGDARTFSLDSPKSRVPAIAALRKAAGA